MSGISCLLLFLQVKMVWKKTHKDRGAERSRKDEGSRELSEGSRLQGHLGGQMG